MADATPGDTSSTPTVAAAASTTAPATAATTQPVAASTDTTPVTAQPTPASTDSTPATAATTADTAPKVEPTTQAAAPVKPAFTLPDDMKLAPEAVEKFQGFITSKSPDAEGKFNLTAQELVDVFADQARSAQQRWKTQLTAQDKTWEAESKSRFTAPQLAAAETGIGFLTSYEPAFRELSKSFRNNPSFVNAMRIVGERLSEDTFEEGGSTPTPAKRQRKDLFYGDKTATN